MIKDYLLNEHSTIRETLVVLDSAPNNLGLIVRENGRLLRTISDGDVRRALLAGTSLDKNISQVPGRDPIYALNGTSNEELISIMNQERVNAIVLVDDQGRPLSIQNWRELSCQILLSPPHIGETERGYVQNAFNDNWIAPAGPNLDAFESRLSKISSHKYAVAVSSGTAGLHLALRALNLHKTKTVYVSDKTFVASAMPILYEGLAPVFIDSEPGTWNMAPQALERRLFKDKKLGTLPGAIIIVHLYGQSARMKEIMDIADSYSIPVIEDAAESLGANYDRQPSGAHGLISVYSFNGNKIITTSGGGAVVTSDSKLAEQVRSLSTQGRDPAEHYQHSKVAYNYRMSNILAGVGLGQLDVLSERVEQRRNIFSRYKDALQSMPGIEFQQDAPQSEGNRWLTVINLDPDCFNIHVYQLIRRLKKYGIETRPSWKPMHMQPLFVNNEFEPFDTDAPVSTSLYLRSLCLPSGSSMGRSDQDRVIDVLSSILAEEAK